MPADRVVIIGAGIGGLAAAIELASRGAEVTILERAGRPGGKLRQVQAGNLFMDAGPTVFTMRWVFEAMFARAGASLTDHVSMKQASILARHGWQDGARLDLYADLERSIDAIGRLSGRHDAEGYRRFVAESRRIYETLEEPFIKSEKPSLPELIARVAAATPKNLWAIQPYATLWQRLGKFFRDPRLRQLFGRYATYCGSSPFETPATLMLIAHVEREGVWLVEGGMAALADAVASLALRCGCEIRYGAHVEEIGLIRSQAREVLLSGGERLKADAVVCNADVNAVASGAFGTAVSGAVPPVRQRDRSLSAMTWAIHATASGFPLIRHNIFFAENYKAEFDDIFKRSRMPQTPTIYVCAQDRGDRDSPREMSAERLFCIMNAPATGDTRTYDKREIDRCAAAMHDTLNRCGLRIEALPEATTVTTPADFNESFPATGGAIYGRASHGWTASFQRATARSRIQRLYFAGGSVHPGAGLPMAALSGTLAAQAVAADLDLTRRCRPAVTPGGMSTASAMTDGTDSR